MMPMTKKYLSISAIAVAMLATAMMVLAAKNTSPYGAGWLPIELHALQLADGWGYEVMVDKKVFIHQDCIPAIAYYRRFNSKSEALLIGNRVVEKIKRGEKPVITQAEIDVCRIHY